MSNFPNGIFAKKPHQNAPEFVKGKISIKVKDALEWLKEQTGEYVNLDLKESKDGKYYLQIDDWKPKKAETEQPQTEQQSTTDDAQPDDDLPF